MTAHLGWEVDGVDVGLTMHSLPVVVLCKPTLYTLHTTTYTLHTLHIAHCMFCTPAHYAPCWLCILHLAQPTLHFLPTTHSALGMHIVHCACTLHRVRSALCILHPAHYIVDTLQTADCTLHTVHTELCAPCALGSLNIAHLCIKCATWT